MAGGTPWVEYNVLVQSRAPNPSTYAGFSSLFPVGPDESPMGVSVLRDIFG